MSDSRGRCHGDVRARETGQSAVAGEARERKAGARGGRHERGEEDVG